MKYIISDTILVCNKYDLPESMHKAPINLGQDLANKWNIPFIVTSAKDSINISQAFELLIIENCKSEQPINIYTETHGAKCCIVV